MARNARAPDLNSQHGGGGGATLVLHVGEGEEADEGMSVVGDGAEEADAVDGRGRSGQRRPRRRRAAPDLVLRSLAHLVTCTTSRRV